jgi:hypothetical protein
VDVALHNPPVDVEEIFDGAAEESEILSNAMDGGVVPLEPSFL